MNEEREGVSSTPAEAEAPAQRIVSLERRLEEQRRELESLAYSISHDLKGPIHTIKGFVEIVLDDFSGGRLQTVKEDLLRINEAASLLQRQLEAVLALSRIGRLESVVEEISTEALAAELRRRWEPAFAQVGGVFQCRFPEGRLQLDTGLFYALCSHLLENALNFRRPDLELQVQLGMEAAAGGLALSFRDNGQGVAPELLERVFELFRRGSAQGSGLGAGLALARRLASRLGGSLRAESAGPGCGTTFFVDLPCQLRGGSFPA